MEKIVASFQPTSGIELLYSDGLLQILPSKPTPNLSDEQLIDWYEQRQNMSFQQLLSYGGSREEHLQQIRLAKARENIGGLGITNRSLQETYDAVPPLKDLLATEHGKVLVLGSGFSELPLELAKMYKNGQLTERPVIVDLFDYRYAYNDLVKLKGLFQDAKISFPFDTSLAYLDNIAKALDEESLSAVRYKIGDNRLFFLLQNASLAINVAGPPLSTMNEQLATLKVGGKLVSDIDVTKDVDTQKYSVQISRDEQTGATFSVVTKIQ
jgi:hypothetical protein